MRIGRAGKTLTLTGAPYYHFWAADFEAYEEEREKKVKASNAKMLRINRLADSINTSPGLSYNDKIKLNGLRNELIDQYNEIVQSSNDLRPEVTVLYDLITRMKAQRANLEQYNPAAYRAARNTMQFSALFRYAKKNNPANWKIFVASLQQVGIKPLVKTPVSWDKP